MKTNAAICWEVNADWSVEEIDIDPPQEGEVLVSFEASGLVAPTNTSAAGIWQARRCPWSADTKAPASCKNSDPACTSSKSAITSSDRSCQRVAAAAGVRTASPTTLPEASLMRVGNDHLAVVPSPMPGFIHRPDAPGPRIVRDSDRPSWPRSKVYASPSKRRSDGCVGDVVANAKPRERAASGVELCGLVGLFVIQALTAEGDALFA